MARDALIATNVGTAWPEDDESENRDRFDLSNLSKVPTQEVAITDLSPGLYLRHGGTNAVHVKLLIDAAGATELPPILVQQNGWRVIDGLHRLEAAKRRGDHSINVRFLDCTDSEALVLAIKSNVSHGLPLSKADRVSGAKRVLSAHPDWSDRVIAGITGLSSKTVGSIRRGSTDGSHLESKRLGRDGRRRPLTAGEGRRRAAEYISAHPDAPLRQVAKAADVSLGTVHDVSTRLRRGVSPDLDKRPAPANSIEMHPAERSHLAEGSVSSIAEASSSGDGKPRRRNHIDAAPTWEGIASKVANDPTIRYTEGGKEFLRWMTTHAATPKAWREFSSAIPVHWLSVLAPIADSISDEWQLFAEWLRSRQDAAR
jgi:hypothetical protein